MTVASVVLDGTTLSFDKKYSYSVPASLCASCVPGVRVTVPFGRGNQTKQGLVMAVSSDFDGKRPLKDICRVEDNEPLLTREMLGLCEWLREQTFCTYFDAIHACLPFGLNLRLVQHYSLVQGALMPTDSLSAEIVAYLAQHGSVAQKDLLKVFSLEDDRVLQALCRSGVIRSDSTAVRNMGDTTMKMVHLAEEQPNGRITRQQQSVLELLRDIGDVSVKEITYFTGVSSSVVDTLSRHGRVELYDKEVLRPTGDFPKNPARKPIVLTDEQQCAFDEIRTKLLGDKGSAHLLYGVTGSGKTQVFLRLVDECVDAGLGVIVMVPEIALTPQTVAHFGNRYGCKVAVFHSAMSYGQRMDEWKRVKNGQALIAVGTRSAVFAPFKKLGLIIMDEEQEHTYKSEQSPRFHARNVARYRANAHQCVFLMASATPSIETYAAAKNGKYGLSVLKSRYGLAHLPDVSTVDMRAEIFSGNAGCISRPLFNELETTLNAGKQAILLLNRRGYHTYVSCPSCGTVATCPHCSISMTYHAANHRLMCHYCGYSIPATELCPACGQGHLRYFGMGTQKVETELAQLFPQARILRLDADSTMTRGVFAKQLSKFADGEYDLMVGTQMVAKGLDFPNVTLVGVIGADQAMYSEDYRSFEKTFSLLTQVVGRAGRGDFAGKAIIQTTSPDSELIHLAVNQDYDSFYETEILTRKTMAYPPFCSLAMVAVTGMDRVLTEQTVRQVFDQMCQLLKTDYQDVKVMILGPSPASVVKVSNRYRFRMIIKCHNTKRFREMLRRAIEVPLKRDVGLMVDMEPETIL